MRTLASAAVLALLVSSAGCSPPVDLKQALQVTDVTSGYFDVGVVEGKNKLVPSVSFKLKKSVDDSLRPLSVNVSFKQLPQAGTAVPPGSPTENDWDEVFLQSVPFEGNQTALLTFKAKNGYTGDPPQTRADMLKNRYFQDVRVHVFAKHSASQWVEIATFDIPRQLLLAH
ncbi:MAG TPA: hypothetical protein VFK57_20705 [Vicinamibacterales bacterium]|nr:hypothetical protein [Vicinamibacterales bacterium]